MLEMRNGFYSTDDDCMQCCKELGNGKFIYIQVTWLDTTSEDVRATNAKDDYDNYVVVSAEIDVNDIDKECAVSGYYKSVQEVIDTYGDSADQIFAECEFENYYINGRLSDIVSWDDAEKIIQKFIDTNGLD